jgi:hypothetical protein
VFEVLGAHVEERVRHVPRRRHQVSSQGIRPFSMKRIFGELGVFRLRGPVGGATSRACDEISRKAGCGTSAPPV